MIPINKPTIIRKDLEYVLNCMITERLEEGEFTKEFEKSITHFLNMKYALATNSYTAAVHLAFLSLNLQPDDEILISAYSEPAILNALHYINAKPILIDVELNSYNMDPKLAEQKITNKTKVIFLNHQFGVPADIDEFLNFNIPIVEDCSYALGSEYDSTLDTNNKLAGNFGILSLINFDTDSIITTGNGGMIVSNSRDHILAAKKFKYNPFMENETYLLQYDYRLPDIASALGLSQLKIIKKFIERRRELANYYNDRFKKANFKVPLAQENKKPVYAKYTILLEKNLDKTIKSLRQSKIDADKPIKSPIYKIFDPEGKEFPHAFQCHNKLIEIPLYPSLKRKEIEKIANTFLRVL